MSERFEQFDEPAACGRPSDKKRVMVGERAFRELAAHCLCVRLKGTGR
jgi:hypothetical protein